MKKQTKMTHEEYLIAAGLLLIISAMVNNPVTSAFVGVLISFWGIYKSRKKRSKK
jgi:hypothetical protein